MGWRLEHVLTCCEREVTPLEQGDESELMTVSG